jgi:hypothetical protein
MEAAARFPELNPDHTGPACSGLGTTARSIFTPRLPPEVRNHSRVSKHGFAEAVALSEDLELLREILIHRIAPRRL